MLGIDGVDIFAFCCLFFIFSYLVYIIYYAIGLYDLNPFLQPKPLTEKEKYILREKIPVVGILKEQDENRLYKRVSWFRSKKTFLFKGPVEDKNLIELLVSASGILLTLGMRNFKFIRSVHKIIIYPTHYYSVINKKQHIGEYNRGLKILVFSAEGLLRGFDNIDDRINLGIHEFAHALYFETSGRSSWESLRFQWGFKRLKKLQEELGSDSGNEYNNYFRAYARTNVFEFFAVAIENYFEAPKELKSKFPEIYRLISKSLNFEYERHSN